MNIERNREENTPANAHDRLMRMRVRKTCFLLQCGSIHKKSPELYE